MSYELKEAVQYFCGNCMIDGQFPILPVGDTRTDADGVFLLSVPDARHDPFFQLYAGRGELVLKSGTRATADVMWDDSLRPNSALLVDATAQPLVVTHVLQGILTGQIGGEFLRQQGLGDLNTYAWFGVPHGTLDGRSRIGLNADAATSHAGYNAFLNAQGMFQVTLPPDTYDLTLGVVGSDGTPKRQIVIAKGLVLHEGERLVVNRP